MAPRARSWIGGNKSDEAVQQRFYCHNTRIRCEQNGGGKIGAFDALKRTAKMNLYFRKEITNSSARNFERRLFFFDDSANNR